MSIMSVFCAPPAQGSIISKYVVPIELGLNKASIFPLVSWGVSCLRGVLGKLQILTGLFWAAVCAWKTFSENKHDFSDSIQGLNLAAHGLANIVRSYIEAMFIIGNILCYVYDTAGIRVQYDSEVTQSKLSLTPNNIMPKLLQSVTDKLFV